MALNYQGKLPARGLRIEICERLAQLTSKDLFMQLGELTRDRCITISQNLAQVAQRSQQPVRLAL